MKGMVQELIAGGSAGAIGVMIGNPLDVSIIKNHQNNMQFF